MTTTFVLPPEAAATAPPESQGMSRDEVRLMAVYPHRVTTTRFRDLPRMLEPGDLLVVNTSATLPARVPALMFGGRCAPRARQRGPEDAALRTQT